MKFCLGFGFSPWTRLGRCNGNFPARRVCRRPRYLRIAQTVRCNSRPPWSTDFEAQKDDTLFELEARLHDAVFKEDFETARVVRDEITSLQSGAFVDVLQAYMKFYKAFDQQSITDMARIWMQDSNVTCKHPVGPLIIGYLNILGSFGSLFSTGMPNIAPENMRISMRGSVAYVTCDEVVEPRRDSGDPRISFREVSENFGENQEKTMMSAINIFVKRNGEYMLTHHSSSPQGIFNL